MLKKIQQFYLRNREGMIASIIAGVITTAILGIPSLFSGSVRAGVFSFLGYMLFSFKVYHLLIFALVVFFFIIRGRKAEKQADYKALNEKMVQIDQLKENLQFSQQENSRHRAQVTELREKVMDFEKDCEDLSLENENLREKLKTLSPDAKETTSEPEEHKYLKSLNKQLYLLTKYFQEVTDNKRQYSSYTQIIPSVNKALESRVKGMNQLFFSAFGKEIHKELVFSNKNVLVEISPNQKLNRIYQMINNKIGKIKKLRKIITNYLKEQNELEKKLLKNEIENRWLDL